MKSDAKVAVTWLEVILVALLLVGGMGAWKLAEHWVGLSLRSEMPRNEQFEQKHQVPDLQVDFAAAEERLKALQQQAVQERLASVKVEAQVNSLAEQYPMLATLPITNMATVPGEALKAYVQASGDAKATELLIKSLESSLTDLISGTLTLSTTLTTQQDPIQQSGTQTRLTLLQNQLAATSTKLVEARLKLAERQAEVAATAAAYPELQKLSQGAVPSLSIQTPIAEAYIAAISELAQRNKALKALEDSLSAARDDVINQTSKLTAARQAAITELEGAAEAFHWKEQGLIFMWTVLGVGLLFVLTSLCTHSVSPLKQTKLNLGAILGISALALLVLYAFQASSIGGASAVAALALIVILGIALSKIPAAIKAGKDSTQ